MDVNLPLDPPVNNSLQATMYDKIDAITFERIRVANSQLNSRLELQEKIINKYRKEAAKIHDTQYKKIHREFRKIHRKKPDYVDDFEYGRTKHDSESKLSKPRSLSDTSDCSSYCRRYYSHHFQIKDRSKEKEDEMKKKPIENDYFNARLRCFFLNMVNYVNNSPGSPDFPEHEDNFLLENDKDLVDGKDLLQESTNTLKSLEENVFENSDSPRQSKLDSFDRQDSRRESKLSKSDYISESNLNKFNGIHAPLVGTVENVLRMGLENICNSGDAKRPTAGLRLEAISPRPRKTRSQKGDIRVKRKNRQRHLEHSEQGLLSRSLDSSMFKTGALQTDLDGYSEV